ncbi:MAG: helicase-related protein [Candidatus Bruticola sp.]
MAEHSANEKNLHSEETKYAPGMRTIIRDEEWLVKKVVINGLGEESLTCLGLSPLVRGREVIFLSGLEEIKIVNPLETQFVADTSSYYTRTRLFLEGLWRQRIPTDNNLHIGHRAAMDSMDYQFRPAMQALEHLQQRILIADSVGLGKTLEAGVLISELIARGKGRRILVVALKSMMKQLQTEMWNRFTIPLVSLDSSKIQRIASQMPSNYNPLWYYDKAIISIDTLKYNSKYNNYLEGAYWDIIIVDEAHNVAERSSGKNLAKRSKLAKLLAKRSDAMIMLSATPHDGRAASFASLMTMLDPTAIADPSNYSKEDVKGLYIRRFRNDIKNEIDSAQALADRVVTNYECMASELEEEAYKVLTDLNLDMDQRKLKNTGDMFFKQILTKSLFSSPQACSETIDERLKKLRKKSAENGQTPDDCPDIARLEALKQAVDKIDVAQFSRYQKLLQLLKSSDYGWNKNDPKDRLIIFTERIKTMEFLAARLKKDLRLKDGVVQTISGKMKDTEQQQIVEDFGDERKEVRILVASDVAAEGLNLHYCCHRLIHFDIPWSLMVFQQRNGRIDRYGQEKSPHIGYLEIKSKNNEAINGDAHILKILKSKEEEAYKNIGDPFLLNKWQSVEEEEGKTAAYMAKQSGQQIEFEESDDDFFEDFFADFEEPTPILDDDLCHHQDYAGTADLVTDRTLFADSDYLRLALIHLNEEVYKSKDWIFAKDDSGRVFDLNLNVLKERLIDAIPEEMMPEGNTLRLSDDKKICMESMKRNEQNSALGRAWPKIQYLWPLHPVINWLNYTCTLLFPRGCAPVTTLDSLEAGEIIFVVSGTLPNRRSDPLVDDLFGLYYVNGRFERELSMDEVINRADLNGTPVNRGGAGQDKLEEALQLRADVVRQVREHLEQRRIAYKQAVDQQVQCELDKIDDLRKKHESFNDKNRRDKMKKIVVLRETSDIFDDLTQLVHDTREVQDVPYIRIAAVFMGA